MVHVFMPWVLILLISYRRRKKQQLREINNVKRVTRRLDVTKGKKIKDLC